MWDCTGMIEKGKKKKPWEGCQHTETESKNSGHWLQQQGQACKSERWFCTQQAGATGSWKGKKKIPREGHQHTEIESKNLGHWLQRQGQACKSERWLHTQWAGATRSWKGKKKIPQEGHQHTETESKNLGHWPQQQGQACKSERGLSTHRQKARIPVVQERTAWGEWCHMWGQDRNEFLSGGVLAEWGGLSALPWGGVASQQKKKVSHHLFEIEEGDSTRAWMAPGEHVSCRAWHQGWGWWKVVIWPGHKLGKRVSMAALTGQCLWLEAKKWPLV